MDARKRCPWPGEDALYLRYHDEEWGVPVHDDVHFFEMLTLEGAQAGLSWITILRKRESYKKAFAGFDPVKVARFTAKHHEKLMQNEGIVRNRAKIESTIGNAKAFLAIQREHKSFDRYLWDFCGGGSVVGRRRSMGEVPAQTELAERLSKDLKKRGFKFVGPTIMYAFLQAVGVVNDHLVTCFRYKELGGR